MGDVAIGRGRRLRRQRRHALVERQGEAVILRDHAQQGQTGPVDGIVDGGVHAAQQLLAYPVDHQVQRAVGEAAQLHDGVLRVPQGGGVRSGDDDAAVGGAGGQPESPAQTGRRVQQAEVEFLTHLAQLLLRELGGKRA